MGNLLSITKSVSLKILITYRIYKWWFLWLLIQQGNKSKYLPDILYSEIKGVFSNEWSYLDYCVKRTYHLISWLRAFPLLVELYCFLLLQENRSTEDDRNFKFLSYFLSDFIQMMSERPWTFGDQYSIMERPAKKLYKDLDVFFKLKGVDLNDLEDFYDLENRLTDKGLNIFSKICAFYFEMRSFYPRS